MISDFPNAEAWTIGPGVKVSIVEATSSYHNRPCSLPHCSNRTLRSFEPIWRTFPIRGSGRGPGGGGRLCDHLAGIWARITRTIRTARAGRSTKGEDNTTEFMGAERVEGDAALFSGSLYQASSCLKQPPGEPGGPREEWSGADEVVCQAA